MGQGDNMDMLTGKEKKFQSGLRCPSHMKGRDSRFIKGTFWGEDKRGYHALDT